MGVSDLDIKRIRKDLERVIRDFKNPKVKRFAKYRASEEILDLIVGRLKKGKVNRDMFLGFCRTLDYLYSTNLRMEPGSVEKLSDRLYVLLTTKGKIHSKININSAHNIISRKLYLSKANRVTRSYHLSFVTKVFHQFNSDMPIVDRTVKQFINRHRNPGSKAFGQNDQISYKTYCEAFYEIKETIKWKLSIDELDLAIWIYERERK